MTDKLTEALALKLKAEWFRHGLHGATLRGEGAIPAEELRRLVASYQRVLLEAVKREDR